MPSFLLVCEIYLTFLVRNLLSVERDIHIRVLCSMIVLCGFCLSYFANTNGILLCQKKGIV